MIKIKINVINKLGIHARPSKLIAITADKFKSKIFLKFGGEIADAKSILSIMLLAADFNSQLELTTEGEDEKEAADSIEKLFKNGFEEIY